MNMNNEGTHLSHYTNTYKFTFSLHQLLEEFDETDMETKRIRKISCGLNEVVKLIKHIIFLSIISIQTT